MGREADDEEKIAPAGSDSKPVRSPTLQEKAGIDKRLAGDCADNADQEFAISSDRRPSAQIRGQFISRVALTDGRVFGRYFAALRLIAFQMNGKVPQV